MHYKIRISPRDMYFKKPVITSRGTYTKRKSWFIVISSNEDPQRCGIGECAPLQGLSCDDIPEYEKILSKACQEFANTGRIDTEGLRDYPSILFGLETALLHFEANNFYMWDTPFSRSEVGIPINGLIWMGSYREMTEEVANKIESGFRCLKLKIGGIDFEKELKILRIIREEFSSREIELRVDANGSFLPDEAMLKLNRLAELDLHSIEQPIRAGQWEDMAFLAANSPVPIALDEELIGFNTLERKRELLSCINPQYVVLKPSLHGGLFGCTQWINEAEERGIGWWTTSALESNIGLNAIAQWISTFDIPMAQGLGTGDLYTNNFDMALGVRDGSLWCNSVEIVDNI